jgi:hypothetical protein
MFPFLCITALSFCGFYSFLCCVIEPPDDANRQGIALISLGMALSVAYQVLS